VHLGTGFLSTPFLLHVLSEGGRLDLAYALLVQDTIPSWLYAVTKGATTIWESWEGVKEDGSLFGSLNHYSYGAVGSWLYQVVAGIEIGAPGYKEIRIQPRPGGGLTYARATYESMHGLIASAWEIEGGTLRLTVVIPPNTRATVRLPGATLDEVQEGDVPLEQAEGIRSAEQVAAAVEVQLGAGQYVFGYPYHERS
jgi:alpha-L-rhamnosidase